MNQKTIKKLDKLIPDETKSRDEKKEIWKNLNWKERTKLSNSYKKTLQ